MSGDVDDDEEASQQLDEAGGPVKGMDMEAATAAAVADMLERAATDGPSPETMERLREIVERHKNVWQAELGTDPPAAVQP